ncbi:hypothetical protein Cni_G12676 [Canna indica]|uniref:Uncharacterized protein n=1 Tax=Canna indica TaxID=4628 RepID=A0AAQ3KDY0_9LILI|nr:hypothetical protein Cni_G12676 [Canna indica]
MEASGKNTAFFPLPKNYVSLKQLQELHLKKKQAEEEGLRNINQQQGTGAKLDENESLKPEEERLRDLSFKQKVRKNAAKTNQKPFQSGTKSPSNESRFVVVARPAPSPNPVEDGAKGGGGGDPEPPIAEASAGNLNAEENWKKSKWKKKNKEKADDRKDKHDQAIAEASVLKEGTGSETIVADPTSEKSSRRNRGRKVERKHAVVPGDGTDQTDELKSSESVFADRSLDKSIQVKEGRRAKVERKPDGLPRGAPERTVQIERLVVNRGDEATAGAGIRLAAGGDGGRNRRAGRLGVAGRGGRGRSMGTLGRVGADLVWVRKNTSS